MKAAVLEAIKRIAVKDIPAPIPKDDEALIKVKTCGMCGTDLKLYNGQYSARVPVGAEERSACSATRLVARLVVNPAGGRELGFCRLRGGKNSDCHCGRGSAALVS